MLAVKTVSHTLLEDNCSFSEEKKKRKEKQANKQNYPALKFKRKVLMNSRI